MKLPALTPRDRRALVLLAVCAAVFTAVYYWPEGEGAVAGTAMSAEQMEQRIRKMRRIAASAPVREETVQKARQVLNEREKGMIRAQTAAQAQVQMLEIVRRVAKNQPETFQIRSTEFGAPQALGTSYSEVVMTVAVESPIDQLITFLADLSNQPELISVKELQLSQAVGNHKLIPARLTVTAVAPRALAPQKKGGPEF